MRYNVELSCEYSGCPGCWWRSQVWFIGNARSYRVWTQSDEDPKRILLKQADEPLGWRRMIADIRELDGVGLGGELLEHIEVSGSVSAWQASLLAMAWCKFDGPADTQLEFLLALRDDTIALLHTGLGGLTANDTLSSLRDVIFAAERMHIPVPVVERGLVELATMFTAGHEHWAIAVEDWLSRHQPPGPSLMDVVEVRGAERLARLVGGPSPTDPKTVALLLERWSVVNPKPFADGTFGRVHTRTTATFLEWAIQRVHSAGFEALAASDPRAARRFAEAFIAHANREIHRYRTSGGGGGIGAAMRVSMARSWNALKKDVLGQELVESARDGA